MSEYNRIPGIVTEGDTARARRSDPPESHTAADGTSRRRKHSWLQIYRALEATGHPMTAQEIIHFIRMEMGEWTSESRVTTAMGELASSGGVERAGKRKNPSGYMAQAWRLAS